MSGQNVLLNSTLNYSPRQSAFSAPQKTGVMTKNSSSQYSAGFNNEFLSRLNIQNVMITVPQRQNVYHTDNAVAEDLCTKQRSPSCFSSAMNSPNSFSPKRRQSFDRHVMDDYLPDDQPLNLSKKQALMIIH